MENLKMKISRGIKEIAVENEKGEITTTLFINMENEDIIPAFSRLIQNLSHVTDEFMKEAEELEDKYKDENEDSGYEGIVEKSRAKVRYIEKCIAEIDAVFGQGTIRNVYKECYDLNKYFVPSEELLIQFVDEVIPIMNELFKQKFQENKRRYSPTKKGKRPGR